MGGMACAARLASKGHSVQVLEHNETWGGKLGSVEHGGYKFDTGPSLLTLPAVYRDLFLKTGAALEDSIEIVDLETAFRYQFADGTILKMPGTGIGRCAEAIGDSLGGNSADQWRAFMRRAAQMWSVTRKPFLESELHGLKSLLALSWRLNDIKAIAPTKTLRDMANHYLDDPRLITLVDRYATYTGSDPRQAPAALATVPYIEQMFGAYHVSGGLRELGRALFERATAIGVKFEFGCTVANIATEPKVSGVTLADGRFIFAFHHARHFIWRAGDDFDAGEQELVLDVRLVQHLDDLLMQALDDGRRRLCRDHDDIYRFNFISGQARCRHRRHAGQQR